MKIFRFVKKVLFTGLTILSSFTNANSLSFISMNNQVRKQDLKLLILTVIIPYFILLVSKQVNVLVIVIILMIDTQEICVLDVVKDLNVKVFNLLSRTNERRHIIWHETCKCICRLDAIVCNNKQRWNKDKCRCECKELIDKGVFDKGYSWNPGNCECECDVILVSI